MAKKIKQSKLSKPARLQKKRQETLNLISKLASKKNQSKEQVYDNLKLISKAFEDLEIFEEKLYHKESSVFGEPINKILKMNFTPRKKPGK